MTSLQIEREITNKKCVEASKEREELAIVGLKALEILQRMKTKWDGASERYYQVLSSILQIVKSAMCEKLRQ